MYNLKSYRQAVMKENPSWKSESRFMGPLTTPIEQVEEALEIFSDALI